jgi:hypothetical protein
MAVVLLILLLFPACVCRHPDQPKSKRPGASAAAAQQQQQQQQQQVEGSSSVEQLETDSDEFEPKQHSA